MDATVDVAAVTARRTRGPGRPRPFSQPTGKSDIMGETM
jgi:hypothetical protein